MSTAGLKTFNITAMRQIYELHNANLQKYPELSGASVNHDSYSNAGMLKVKPESSAFPFRHYNHLAFVMIDSSMNVSPANTVPV